MGDGGDVHGFGDYLLGQGLAQSTVREYVRLARGWTRWLERHRIDLVAGHHAREWTDTLPQSRSSRKAAQAMLRWWQRWHLGEDIGLCQAVRVPGRSRPDPDPLTTEEWQRLVATAELAGGRAGLATLIIAFTGARPSEVALMCWDHWDGVRLRWWRPKTQDWHELLAADVLRDQLDGHKGSGAMFAGDGGRPHVTSQTVWGWVRRIGRLADVDVHPRRLRSTVATEVLERTGSIDATAAVLGHASVDSTRHYARTSRRRLDQAVCTLNTGPGHAKAPTRP
jgi:integrase